MANTVYPRIKTDPAQYKKAAFSKTWESAEDFPTVELSEERVRADMQALHDEMKEYVNDVLIKDVAESFDAVADVVVGKVDSVNGKTGDVTLTAADVGAVPVGEGGIIGVASVNDRSGNVTLTSEDVGLGNLDNERQYSASNPPPYPVASVNGKTGAVNLTADDIGARPSDWTPSKSNIGLGLVENERQYSAANPPPYPVTAVNGQTGDVAVQAKITASGILKGNGAGGVSAAVKGTDYAAPSVGVSVTLTASGWNENAKTQTVSVSGVTATANGSLRIAQSATDEQFAAWGAAQPRVTA